MEFKNADGLVTGWHAHVYFDPETTEPAKQVREAVEARFEVNMGRWHEKPVGPHPMWSYQIAFGPDLLGDILSWLSLNRRGLTIFVHPETGDDIPDHTDHAVWLGEKMDLNLDALR